MIIRSDNKDNNSNRGLRESKELNESMTISPKIKEEILKMFRTTDNDVLDSYTKSNEFVVECDNSNATYLGRLQTKLMTLEDKYDIGFEKESNDNGFYGYTYTFYKYPDSGSLSESESLNEAKNSTRELKKSLTSLINICKRPIAAIVDGGNPASITISRIDLEDGTIFCDLVIIKVEEDYEVVTRKNMGYNISKLGKVVRDIADFSGELHKITNDDAKLIRDIYSVLDLY